MKNPYTKLPGYVGGYNEYPSGWVVVFDRQKIEPFSEDRMRNRWLAKHMESGKTRVFPTKDMAKFEAYRAARSIHSYDHWW